jgi:RNA methyltransferase, TrmH family
MASPPPRAPAGARSHLPAGPRAQLAGPGEIAAALGAGAPLRLLLVAAEPRDPRVAPLVEQARALGVAVHTASPASLWRLSKVDPPAEVLGLVGPDPGAPRAQVLAAGGALWLLVGTAYPGNTGFAIRTAEVSGADGIFVANAFDHEARREALRAAMRADRVMPVFWEPALPVIEDARAAGRRIYAVEDVGTAAPWEVDLAGAVLLVVGGERLGIPADVLDACDAALRIPMRGFIPSYNLQAAMAAVASERLRQVSTHP